MRGMDHSKLEWSFYITYSFVTKKSVLWKKKGLGRVGVKELVIKW